jgi:hypothetical protein
MKYATETGAGAMIYMRSFTKAGSDIRNLMGGDIQTQTYREDANRISLLSFFQNKAS